MILSDTSIFYPYVSDSCYYLNKTGKMKKKILSIVSWASILLTNCSFPHYYYSSNIQNVPLFKESNEFSGLMAGSFGAVNNSLELQAGYSFPGHVALTANYMTGGNDNSSDSYEDYSKNHYFEGTLGFYKSFKNIGIFEIYGGYGQGSQRHAFAYKEYSGGLIWTWVPDGKADLSFSKIFIQPDIGIKIKWLEGAFSCRLSKLNFREINIYNTVYRLDELNIIKQNSTPWLIEPAFTIRAGGKSVKGQVQFVSSRNLTNPNLMFEDFRVNAGLHFNLSKKRSQN